MVYLTNSQQKMSPKSNHNITFYDKSQEMSSFLWETVSKESIYFDLESAPLFSVFQKHAIKAVQYS